MEMTPDHMSENQTPDSKGQPAISAWDADAPLLWRFLEASPEAIIGTDGDFIVRFRSRAASALLGLVDEQSQQINVFDLLPGDRANVFRTDLEQHGSAMVRFPFSTGDGQSHVLEARAVPFCLAGGTPGGYSFSFRNVTGQAGPDYRQAVEAERAMLDKTLEQLPSGVIIVDAPDGAIMRVNRAALEMFQGKFVFSGSVYEYRDWAGYTPEGVPYQPEDWPAARSIRTGEVVVNEEITFPIGDGEHAIMAVSAAPVRDSQGKIIAGVVVVVDITERKKLEEAQLENQQRLALALKAADMIAWEWDAASNHMEITGEFRELYGLSGPVRGEDAIRMVLHEDRHDHLAQVKKALREGKSYYSQFRIRRGESGDLCWLEEWGIPVSGADGRLRKLIGVVKDITDQKRTEDELRSSQHSYHLIAERFRASVESLLDGFAILSAVRDENGKVVDFRYDYMNEMGLKMGNRTYEQQVGQSLLEMLPAHIESGLFDRYVRLLEDGIPVEVEDKEYVDTPGGKLLLRTFEVRAMKLGDGFVVTWRDITERKRTEEQLLNYAAKLERSNEELDQFALIASHDLQEPLRKIRQFSDSVRRILNAGLPPDADDALNRMQRAAERMQAMINGLLELSRVNTRGGKFEPADLTRLAKEVISDLEPRLEASRGQVRLDPLPTAEVDEVQFRRLLQNLISNALKYYRKGVPPVVEVRGSVLAAERDQPARLLLIVRDNGIGFNEEDAQRIFRPFQRLHGIGEYEGTGMGLAICQKIVERHRGKIEVSSKAGEGSTFTVIIPLQQR